MKQMKVVQRASMKALNEQNTAIYYMANKLMILLDFIKVMPVFNQYCIKLLGAMLKELSPVKSKSPVGNQFISLCMYMRTQYSLHLMT